VSSYRVFARKYRPQRFEEVVGQEHITRTLQNAIKGNRLAQAYLFVGPRGVGKTSTARILAKTLNCQADKRQLTDNPCGECDACVEIAEGRSLDVMEIDGASNNSVDSIRTLRENAAYAPARGPYKVYLIDEVHMLSPAAFNALLKTLEEPPEHVKFLFATTEAQKIPPTILSRCQRFDLRRLSPELIAAHLLYIAKCEKITLEPTAADAIARGADGALRDAESMLDQVVSFCGSTIGAGDVHQVFGFTPRETVLDLGRSLVARDTRSALALIQSQSDAGKDLSRLLSDLVNLLRDTLVKEVHPQVESIGDGSDASLSADSIKQEKLLVLLDHFGEAEGRLRWATDKKLQLDVALIKGIHLLEEASLSDVLDVLTALRSGEPLPDRPVPKPASPNPISAKSVPTPKDGPVARVQPTAENPEPEANSQIATNDPPSTISENNPWHAVAMALAADSPLKFGWLEDGRFLERAGNKVIVEFPPSSESRTETTFWNQAVKKIEEMLSSAIGTKISLECTFTGEEPPPEPVASAPAAPATVKTNSSPARAKATSSSTPPAETAPQAISPEELEAFKNDPLIKKALEIFQAEILVGPQEAGS